MAENITQKRKDEAREFAIILYEIYKKDVAENDKMESGQNNAKQDDSN